MYNKMKALYLYKLNKNKAKHTWYTFLIYFWKSRVKNLAVFFVENVSCSDQSDLNVSDVIIMTSQLVKTNFTWGLEVSVFTDSFYCFFFVYGELTCVVLKCVSYQDTVRL